MLSQVYEKTQVLKVLLIFMERDRLGGVPYEATKEGKKVKLRFFPKGDNAKNPNSIVFTMLLDDTDKEKILDLFK